MAENNEAFAPALRSKYSIQIDAGFLPKPEGEAVKAWTAWGLGPNGVSQAEIVVSAQGFRGDWKGQGTKSNGSSMLKRAGKPAVLLFHEQKLAVPARSKATRIPRGAWATLSRRSVTDERWGPLEEWEGALRLRGDQVLYVRIAAIESQRLPGADLRDLWQALLPWFGEDTATLGLPVLIEWRTGGGAPKHARMTLESMKEGKVSLAEFSMPKEYGYAAREQKQLKVERDLVKRPKKQFHEVADEIKTNGEAAEHAASLIFQMMPNEVLKFLVSGQDVLRTLQGLGRVGTFFGSFTGRRFVLNTADWFRQAVHNAPFPRNERARSVLPPLMVRVAVGMIGADMRSLDLANHMNDIDAAVEALQDNDKKKRWRAFLSLVDRQQRRNQLNRLAERLVPGFGPNSPQNAQGGGINLGVEVYQDMDNEIRSDPRIFRTHPNTQLAESWYGSYLPWISLAPESIRERRDTDEQIVLTAAREIEIRALADLVDISLNDFEHEVSFNTRPLLGPISFVDGSQIAALSSIPGLGQLVNFRLGFLTSLNLPNVSSGCDIDVAPAGTAATVALALFCPPCFLSLFMTGSANALLEETVIPLLVYAWQDPLGLDPPQWRVALGEPQFGDVDFSIFLFSLNPVIFTIVNVLGNLFGDVILEAVLGGMRSQVQETLQEAMKSVPAISPSSIVAVGPSRPRPDLLSPQLGVGQRVAYRAPVAQDGTFHVEAILEGSFDREIRGPLVFPQGGAPLGSNFAAVLSDKMARDALSDVSGVFTFEILTTQKNGSISEIDWWAEIPDQTGLPPRPAHVQSGPLPPVVLLPQNVGQTAWRFRTWLRVKGLEAAWRDLNGSAPSQAVADVTIQAQVIAEAVKYEVVMYDVCDDVTHVAAELLDRLRGGRPIPPRGPRSEAVRLVGIDVEGRFRRRPLANEVEGQLIDGPFDNLTYNRTYALEGDPRRGLGGPQGTGIPGELIPGEPESMPLPDDPGPTPVPGVLLCNTVISWNSNEIETWVDADVRFRLPVYLHVADTVDNLVFLPRVVFRLKDIPPDDAGVQFTLVANGPLQTLDLPENRAWLRQLLIDQAYRVYHRAAKFITNQNFDYSFNVGFALPERINAPIAALELGPLTTFPGIAGSKNVAMTWVLNEQVIDRL